MGAEPLAGIGAAAVVVVVTGLLIEAERAIAGICTCQFALTMVVQYTSRRIGPLEFNLGFCCDVARAVDRHIGMTQTRFDKESDAATNA